MIVFGVTNGYVASLAMMFGPAAVEPRQRELAGFVMTTSLQAGLFIGSQVALAMQRVFAA